MENLKKWIRHNKPLVISIVVAIGLGVYMFGCSPSVRSPFNPETKVTRAELDIDVETYVAKVRLAYADLAQQELIRQKIAEIGLTFAEGGGVNPLGAVTTLLGIVGIGGVATYGKKNTLITALKNANKEKVNG